jgi:hypothetical protein
LKDELLRCGINSYHNESIDLLEWRDWNMEVHKYEPTYEDLKLALEAVGMVAIGKLKEGSSERAFTTIAGIVMHALKGSETKTQ